MSHRSYFMVKAGAAVTLGVVSHLDAEYLCLKAEQTRGRHDQSTMTTNPIYTLHTCAPPYFTFITCLLHVYMELYHNKLLYFFFL